MIPYMRMGVFIVSGRIEYKYGSRYTINGILGIKKKGKRIRNDETALINQTIVDERNSIASTR